MGFAYQPAVWHEFYYALVQWRAMVAGDSMQDQPQLPQEQTTAEQPHPLQKQDTAEHLPSPSTEPGTYLGLERIVFFSDAVMAIAITLLVLDIRLPSLHAGTTLTSALFRLWPSYFSFAYSFLVVGSFWWGHHRTFRHVQRYDDALIWLNILFLLCIAFIPFASSVLGEHIGNPSAAVFYALVTIMTGLAETLLWLYASRGHRLVAADLSARSIQFSTLRVLSPPVVFLLSLPLVLLSPYVAMVAWIAVYPLLVALLRAETMEYRRRGGGP